MATDDVQFRIRLSPQVKERLETIASEEGRSLNAEIARRLESSLTGFRYTKREEWQERLSGLDEWIRQTDEQMGRLSKILIDITDYPDMADLLKPMIITKLASLQHERDRLFGESVHVRSMLQKTSN